MESDKKYGYLTTRRLARLQSVPYSIRVVAQQSEPILGTNSRNPYGSRGSKEVRKYPTTAQKLSIIIHHNPNGQQSLAFYR
ncbi:hypothetical protein AAMO2058_001143800 [Amorphochlora amoebiformis]